MNIQLLQPDQFIKNTVDFNIVAAEYTSMVKVITVLLNHEA